MYECIIWQGAKTPDGYPRATYNGNENTRWHRVMYCEYNGCSLESIDGKVIRHTCDTPLCVQPEHLMLGTEADNMRDRDSRQRHGQAKISHTDVRTIRTMIAKGFSNVFIAREFNINPRTVSSIKCGHHWKHVL